MNSVENPRQARALTSADSSLIFGHQTFIIHRFWKAIDKLFRIFLVFKNPNISLATGIFAIMPRDHAPAILYPNLYFTSPFSPIIC
jgi:hypothetical protein